MKQGQETTRKELLSQGWVFLYVFKRCEMWEKNNNYLLFDPEERIILATLEN